MKQNITVFNGGLNQDVGYDKLKEGTYFDAQNMRIVTSDGGTTGNLENIKGNQYQITYPDISNIFKFIGSTFEEGKTFTWTFSIETSGVKSFNTEQSYKAMAEAINNDPVFSTMGVIAYSQTSDELYAKDSLTIIIKDYGRISSIDLLSQTAGVLFHDFLDPDNTYGQAVASGPWGSSPVQFRNSSTNLRTIGWANMRDDIILWTTDETVEEPTSSYGQLWRLTYDKISLDCTLTLLYHNLLNFSTAHPIANPGMVLARYETPSIQRVYWTDNYNVPRTCNVADPDLFSKDPSLLQIDSIVSPYVFIPQRINQGGGSLNVGIYQIAYRLNETGGGQTSWFMPSYPITIVQKPEGSTEIATFRYTSNFGGIYEIVDTGYDGDLANLSNTDPQLGQWISGAGTGKSITYNLGILDTNYSTIEIAMIFRRDLDSTPDINIISEEPIVADSFNFTLTGDEDRIPLTLEEFNSINQSFDRVGTMNTKDDYLFFGDVTLRTLEVDYDARAYRFDGNRIATLKSPNYPTVSIDGSVVSPDYTVVSEDHDCINTNDSPVPNSSGIMNLYKADGTTFGGEGPNISYEFIEEEFELDKGQQPTNGQAGAPYRNSHPSATNSYDLNSSTPHNQVYFSPETFHDYHSPYTTGFMKGYQRDETYRFGIVFYDQQGNPSWTKWIADIRMPHVWMPTTPTSTLETARTMTYPLTTTGSIPTRGNALGIQFTVNNLDTLPDEVSGYSIVRVKREADNRSIVGQGLFHPAIYDTFDAAGNSHRLVHSDHATFDVEQGGWGTAFSRVPSNVIGMFLSPEFLVEGTRAQRGFQSGDNLDIVSLLTLSYTANPVDETGTARTEDAVVKNYGFKATCAPITGGANSDERTPYPIEESLYVPAWKEADQTFLMGTEDVVNHTFWSGHGGSGQNALYYQGPRCQALRFEGTQIGTSGSLYGWDLTGSDFGNADGFYTGIVYDNKDQMYLANYRRAFNSGGSLISTQYSSNTYIGRSSSEYISTNHYQKIAKGTTTYANKVYGGDTMICVYDVWRDQQDLDSAPGFRGNTWKFFPVETWYNIEMRQPPTEEYNINSGPRIPNKHFINNDDAAPLERLIIAPAFSVENDVKKFYPQPVPYLEQDEFDTRIYNNSFPKINGELYDQWKIFKSDDYIQADTEHGRVTSLINQADTLLFLQDRAIGVYQVNERAAVPDETGTSIVIGTGGVGERIDYISTRVGSFHKFGVAQSPNSMIFFDMFSKKLYIFGESLTTISDLKGLSGFLDRRIKNNLLVQDNPVKGDFITSFPAGITSTYDYRYNEYLVTFHDSKDPVYATVRDDLVCEGLFDNVVTGLGTELVQDRGRTDAIYLGSSLGASGTDYFDLNTTFPTTFSDPDIWMIDAGPATRWAFGGANRAEVTGTGPTWGSNLIFNSNPTDIQIGRDYRIECDLTRTAGSIAYIQALDGQVIDTNVDSTTNYSVDLTATSVNSHLSAFEIQTNDAQPAASDPPFRGDIDNVSIKEITYDLDPASCWTETGDWVFKNNKATKTTTSAATLTQTIANHPVVNSYYNLKFRLTNTNNSGGVTASLGGTPVFSPGVNADGYYEYTVLISAVASNDLIFTFSNDFLGSISEIELYESVQVQEGSYDKFTIVFNELFDAFTAFYTLTPSMWINNKRNIITPHVDTGTEDLYFWDEGNFGEFNGAIQESHVTALINHDFMYEKIFDNFVLNCKAYDIAGVDLTQPPVLYELRSMFDQFMVYNGYQNTGLTDLDDTNSRMIKRKWNVSVGGSKLVENFTDIFTGPFEAKAYTQRIKSNYAFAKFVLSNQQNFRFVFESLLTKYRVSYTNRLDNGKT